jgi:hypothetical protein
MNKFVTCKRFIAEIRPNREWRWFASIEPVKMIQGNWLNDVPIDDEDSWENEIEHGRSIVINIEEFIEKNFEHML